MRESDDTRACSVQFSPALKPPLECAQRSRLLRLPRYMSPSESRARYWLFSPATKPAREYMSFANLAYDVSTRSVAEAIRTEHSPFCRGKAMASLPFARTM